MTGKKDKKENPDELEKSLKSYRRNLILLIIAGLIAIVLGIVFILLIFIVEGNAESNIDPVIRGVTISLERSFALVL
ncbi:MAG: hypothetical protein M3162_09315 [Thermoproteota archaeon]|nr:hypothetical protein [Thermoproteota archaeon]